MGIYIIIGILVLAGAALFIFKMKKVETVDSSKNQGESEIEKMNKQIYSLNVEVRTKIFDQEVVSSFERIFDGLISLSEEMEKASYNETKELYERIINKYIPNILFKYSCLRKDEQLENKADIITSTAELEKQVQKINVAVKTANKEDLVATSYFMTTRFQ